MRFYPCVCRRFVDAFVVVEPRIQSSLAPRVRSQGKDRATPRNRKLCLTAANRLYKRKGRQHRIAVLIDGKESEEDANGFLHTEASRRKAAGEDVGKLMSVRRLDRGGCSVCGAMCTRFCVCGVSLETNFNSRGAGDFVDFVRSPGVPVYRDDDAADQEEFLLKMQALAGASQHPHETMRHVLVRACALGAITGEPKSLDHCHPWVNLPS